MSLLSSLTTSKSGSSMSIVVIVVVVAALLLWGVTSRCECNGNGVVAAREHLNVLNLQPPTLATSGATMASATVHRSSSAVNVSKAAFARRLGTSL